MNDEYDVWCIWIWCCFYGCSAALLLCCSVALLSKWTWMDLNGLEWLEMELLFAIDDELSTVTFLLFLFFLWFSCFFCRIILAHKSYFLHYYYYFFRFSFFVFVVFFCCSELVFVWYPVYLSLSFGFAFFVFVLFFYYSHYLFLIFYLFYLSLCAGAGDLCVSYLMLWVFICRMMQNDAEGASSNQMQLIKCWNNWSSPRSMTRNDSIIIVIIIIIFIILSHRMQLNKYLIECIKCIEWIWILSLQLASGPKNSGAVEALQEHSHNETKQYALRPVLCARTTLLSLLFFIFVIFCFLFLICFVFFCCLVFIALLHWIFCHFWFVIYLALWWMFLNGIQLGYN